MPLGDLTRAALASEASGREFGTLAATVTVQELTFNLMLVLCALPVMLEFGHGVGLVVATLLTMVAITLILTVSPIFRVVHDLVAHIPLLRRLLPAIEDLQAETASLLHTPDALWLSVLDLLRALVSIAAFWLVVEGFSPGVIDERKAAFVLAVSSIGGAISLIPGGVGANEASVAGLLILFGVLDGPAGAAALIQRFLMTAMAIGFGLAAYAVVRRRFKLGGIFQLISHPPGGTDAGSRHQVDEAGGHRAGTRRRRVARKLPTSVRSSCRDCALRRPAGTEVPWTDGRRTLWRCHCRSNS